MTAWDVRYARQFGEQLAGLPDPVYDRVEASIDVIAANPGLARGYDPTYEAARPPVPVVSASSTATPSGWGCAATARRSMRVRSSVHSALMGVFTRLCGLQKLQGFLEMRSCACAHLRACLSRRKGLATLLGA